MNDRRCTLPLSFAFLQQQAQNLRKMHYMSEDELAMLCANFEEFGEAQSAVLETFASLLAAFAFPGEPARDVTSGRRSEYVGKRVKAALKDSRIVSLFHEPPRSVRWKCRAFSRRGT